MEEKIHQKEGYIIDYISGQEIKGTPEEIEAVQPFAIQLVEDYNYPKSHLQTRPQFRVKASPSDTTKKYPVDIAVFNDENKIDSDLYIIVECKKKTKRRIRRFDHMTNCGARLRTCSGIIGKI